MKSYILTILASILSLSAFGSPGTINLYNFGAFGRLDAPVFHSDGITRLSGPTYAAQLLAGPTPDSLEPAGAPAPFWTNAGAGYFVGGMVSVPNVQGGHIAYCEIVAWDTTLLGTTTGATAEPAYTFWREGHADVWGASFYDYDTGTETPFPVVTGNMDALPPTPPASLLGLESFSLAVPEPSALALAVLGVTVLVGAKKAKRRRRD